MPAASIVATGSEADALTLSVTLAPQAIRLSLVFATLQYELRLTNTGGEATRPVQVRADLASAHSSLDTRAQLAPEPSRLEAKHDVPALAAGEAATLKGELRVPLQDVRAVAKGTARFFVPLARFCLIAANGRAMRRVFTVGPQGEGGLNPIRLDAGPRNLRELGAREIEAARAFALDPAIAQG